MVYFHERTAQVLQGIVINEPPRQSQRPQLATVCELLVLRWLQQHAAGADD